MNAKYTLIGAAVCAAILSGCAQMESDSMPDSSYYSSGSSNSRGTAPKTRAEVRAEVDQAYREGTLHPPGEELAYPYVYPCRPQRSLAC